MSNDVVTCVQEVEKARKKLLEKLGSKDFQWRDFHDAAILNLHSCIRDKAGGTRVPSCDEVKEAIARLTSRYFSNKIMP